MKKWFLILGLLVVVGVALATSRRSFVQPMVTPVTGESFTPTNIAGYPAQSVWSADDYTTNTTPELPDWMGNITLTNLDAATTWPKGVPGGLNGHQVLLFSADYLTRSGISNSQPNEYFVVMATNGSAIAQTIVGYHGEGHQNSLQWDGGEVLISTLVGDLRGTPNNFPSGWNIVSAKFNGANSAIYINGVEHTNGNVGTGGYSGWDGKTIGGRVLSGTPSGYYYGYIAMMICYNTNLTDSLRSNVVSWLKTRFGL